MVISFGCPPAFTQLRDERFVVSFRANERKRTPLEGTQKTWCNRGRGSQKQFDVRVRHLENITGTDSPFAEFQEMSGFTDRESWLRAVRDIHGDIPQTGHFYLVTRVAETNTADEENA